ncbi:MAG: ABC transporter ATP-binding protein [Burkholderiales bacterium]|nr:ABC transporter ATP-binding protein [Burkholderiales bacterium]
MISFLSDLGVLLDARDRRRMALIAALMILIGCVEVLGVGSILPFLAVASDPALVTSNRVMAAVYDRLGMDSPRDFIVALGVLAFVLVTVGNLLNALSGWALSRFAIFKGNRIAALLLAHYLRRPYAWHFSRHSADLVSGLFLQARRFTVGVLEPTLIVFSKSIVAVAVFALLIAVDPVIAVSMTAALCAVYAIYYRFVRGFLYAAGERVASAGETQVRVATESLSAIKEVKAFGAEDYFARRFGATSLALSRSEGNIGALAHGPRYVIEAFAFGGVVLIVLAATRSPEAGQPVLPTIALYAFAGYRLLPALQQVFTGIANVRFNLPALETLSEEMRQALAAEAVARRGDEGSVARWSEVCAREVAVAFEPGRPPALDGITARVGRGQAVALVGSTGAGKSTLVDVLGGLVQPTSGNVTIDGLALEAVRDGWSKQIGLVPQHPVLLDATIAENIAFGVESEAIDATRLRRAVERAQLAGFIERELPQRYQTVVGERGIRLSGGQRQRLALARALYREPSLLILDEATSAVDAETERQIFETVLRLRGEMAVIAVAHHVAALRGFDRVLLLDRGRLAAEGGFEELLAANEQFQTLAQESTA